MKDATDHNNSDVNSVSAVKFSTLVKEASTEKNTVIEAKTKAEEKKMIHRIKDLAKKALLESNSDDSTLLSLSSGSEKLVEKKTESDSFEKNAEVKLSLLASFSESSSSEMANISRSTKRAHEPENDRESIVSRMKKRFKLDKNHYYQNNEKLRMSCKVHLTRLNTKVSKSSSYALRKSREYLEHKALKSFVNLDKLEKRRKENAKEDSDSLTDDDSSSKISKSSNKRKGKTKLVKEETLMDHFEKVQDSDVMATVEISSDTEESDCQIKNIDDIPMSDEALISEADRIAKNNLLNSSDSDDDFIINCFWF
ncbi:PREDICTED: uncharacterized protein LOC105459017 isoform X2 [Wasmannia auropunctata]|uniref:uncharacterized protein LOC105459017 isoform X2 n=1 Tax=Wasmannia auropunctata TaxID=64793 RepID=UPI0005ED5E56|nr:PREDICTED: uncharacterized protein LOC105459017 isoform X2 [Wasmannia auropunctata]